MTIKNFIIFKISLIIMGMTLIIQVFTKMDWFLIYYLKIIFFSIKEILLKFKNRSFYDYRKLELNSSFSSNTTGSVISMETSSKTSSKKSRRRKRCEINEEEKTMQIDPNKVIFFLILFRIFLKKVENDGRTTLMIKHIPNKYTKSLLLEKIDKNFQNTYNFFYLPIDLQVRIFSINLIK